jgi:hypothetical protein
MQSPVQFAGLGVFLLLVERLSSNTADSLKIMAEQAVIEKEKASDPLESLAFFAIVSLRQRMRARGA